MSPSDTLPVANAIPGAPAAAEVGLQAQSSSRILADHTIGSELIVFLKLANPGIGLEPKTPSTLSGGSSVGGWLLSES